MFHDARTDVNDLNRVGPARKFLIIGHHLLEGVADGDDQGFA